MSSDWVSSIDSTIKLIMYTIIVARDKHIKKLSKKFKKYSWDTNFGYGTKKHQDALKKFGVTSHHRKTFKPIHKILSQK